MARPVWMLLCLVFLLAADSKGEDVYVMGKQGKPPGCHELWLEGDRTPGIRTIYPNGSEPIKVYCNNTEDSSYTLIQQRVDGSVNFYTNWAYYRSGFGDPRHNYWAGLQNIYHLTHTGYNVLRVDAWDWSHNHRYAIYHRFSVDSELSRYKLHVAGYSGNLGDDLTYSNNMQFATFDKPDKKLCVDGMKVGWWYNACSRTLLNGHYYVGGSYKPKGKFYDGIFWSSWHGYGYSLKTVQMTLLKI